MNGNELKDSNLAKVTGGLDARREKTLRIDLPLPTVDYDVELTIYVDGVQDRTDRVCPEYVAQKSYEFKGSQGKKDVRFKVDGLVYAVYELDFDAYTVTKLV